MSLAVHLMQAVRRLARHHKYTLGQDLRRSAHRLSVLVARANDATGFRRRTLLAWGTLSAAAAATPSPSLQSIWNLRDFKCL